jgi:hypothetical protein
MPIVTALTPLMSPWAASIMVKGAVIAIPYLQAIDHDIPGTLNMPSN